MVAALAGAVWKDSVLRHARAASCGSDSYATPEEYVECVAATPYRVPDSLIDGAPSTRDPYSRYQWALRVLLENTLYDRLFRDAPRDVIVAVIDRWPGHGRHADLVGVYLPGINLVEGGTDTSGKWDGVAATSSNLHGQCAASIIAAEHNGVGIAGVFHRARILPIRSSVTTFAQAIRVAVQKGAEVIHIAGYEYTAGQMFHLFPESREANHPAYGTAATRETILPLLTGIRTALERAEEAGIVLTQGLGNRTGKFTSNWIASRPQVIVVGATNIHNEVSPFNSVSFRYEVFAPGGDRRHAATPISIGPDVISDAPNANADDVLCALGNDRYSFMSGGSAAAPQVAAAAAIVKSYLPKATPAEVRRIIARSTRPSTPTLNVIQSTGGVLSLKLLRDNIKAASTAR